LFDDKGFLGTKNLFINRMTTASEKQFTFISAIEYTIFEILQEESRGILKKF